MCNKVAIYNTYSIGVGRIVCMPKAAIRLHNNVAISVPFLPIRQIGADLSSLSLHSCYSLGSGGKQQLYEHYHLYISLKKEKRKYYIKEPYL